ncbi:Yip1 domain-containing protein [Dioscorea alata]|uniref:Yip1 domain-containing protein n=1 Tax=Dioscorea alata TaxID=55571 RepID=A0ACB7V3A4_DIOAL|nr:Yip1 domain-containing protein [Dioscorea alata]
MAKEFNVPPVVFQSSGATPAAVAHQRHTSSAPASAPAFKSSSILPFMPFDLSSTPASSSFSTPAAHSFNVPAYPSISGSGFFSSSFDEEPPLLEELGINTRQIWLKITSILNPFRVNPVLHEDADLSGPFLSLMAFGLFQLLAGKFHFGIILGWVTVASLFLYGVFNMLAGRYGNLDLHRCLSLVGYCMIPMVIFSAVSLFISHSGVPIFVAGAVFVLWSTRVCTRLLIELASCGDEHRWLIAYACWLVYLLFALLVIF